MRPKPVLVVTARRHIIVHVLPLGERILIRRIREQAARGRKSLASRSGAGTVLCGIGDDAAVLRLPAGHEILVTTDFSLEDIHFRRQWHTPATIGHRTLLRGLSDIAAMGGVPLAAFLSLGVPANLPQPWMAGFLKGLVGLATRFGVSLAGGDTSESAEKILADIIVVGSVPRGKAILRSGAKVGDRIYVTGQLGLAAARLAQLYALPSTRMLRDRGRSRLPIPRLVIGQFLRQKGIAHSMIDVSDGLSTDLSHICEESQVGAEIREEAIPRARLEHASVDIRFALHGGDDYELLFTADPGARLPGTIDDTPVTAIGEITRAKKLVLVRAQLGRVELRPAGWEHFRQS